MANPNENTPSLLENIPVVTGRKAARSLKLFRGDGLNLDALIDIDDQKPDGTKMSPHDIVPAGNNEELNSGSNGQSQPMLEPVSSATYFPHNPMKDNVTNHADTRAPPTDDLETDRLQHLMADLEFDSGSRGELTKIKKHTREDVELQQNTRHAHKPETNTSSQPDNAAVKPNEIYPLSVELRPFKNKVGGHTAIFRFSERAVCKALMNRENLWYEAVEHKHLELWKFMPKYIGVLNVRYSSIVREEESTPKLGPASPSAHNASNEVNDLSGDFAVQDVDEDLELDECPQKSRKRCTSFHTRVEQNSSFTDADLPPEVSLDDNRHMIPDLLWKKFSSSAPTSSTMASAANIPEEHLASSSEFNEAQHFSIGSTCVNRDLQAQVIQEVFVPQSRKSEEMFMMDDDQADLDDGMTKQNLNLPEPRELINPVLRKHTRFERFILLEDLTADMKKPCALDLKMGTRQYGVEANDSKQASQRKKCASTTSRQLGVRVCGLQVWNKAKKSFFMRDKYFGRKLKRGKPFAKILAKFLFDGVSALSIVKSIPLIIDQLEELYLSFQDLEGYRMYGSSVLLMYDGAASSSERNIKVHIIDFAQSVIGDDTNTGFHTKPPSHPSLPDMGYLRGLQSLIYYFKQIFRIVSGQDYEGLSEITDIADGQKLGPNNDEYWADLLADEEMDVPSKTGFDPFDVEYLTETDETGISE